MSWGASDIPDLTGKVAIVTGSTDGLGRQIAGTLAARGASVIVSGRSAQRGRKAASEFGATFEPLDLADLAAIHGFAAVIAAHHPRVDILVNNAGVSMIPDLTRTADGLEMQMGVNFLGHFALVSALLPQLLASPAARVVNVSSIAAGHVKMDFENWLSGRSYRPGKAYGWSKLAMLIFARELDERARSAGWALSALAAHPGVASSNLQNAGPSLGRTKRTFITRIGNLVTDVIGQSTAQGALPILRAATDPQAKGGSYYGPDGWGGIKGDPVVVAPPASANDPAIGTELWRRAEEITGAAWPHQ